LDIGHFIKNLERSTAPMQTRPMISGAKTEKPAHISELSPRAILCGLLVAVVMGAAYPYIVLKLGFGPNVSVVAAFFGYLALGIAFKDYNRWENNIVQTAGTSAAQTAFMCVLLAAFDMLGASKTISFHLTLSPWQSFAWLSIAGLLGVLLAVPMRQHFVIDEKLPYPDGIAAGETLMVLDSRGPEARRAARALAFGAIASAALMLMTEDARVVTWLPSITLLGTAVTKVTGVGINWSLLSAGSGMLIGLRVTTSMLLGSVLSWIIGPYVLLHFGVIHPGFAKNDVLFWVMWPATAMMVAGGLTALVLRWRLLLKTFTALRSANLTSDTFPLRWVISGSIVLSIALIIVQKINLGVAPSVTFLAILLSLPLMLVGLRVFGETNWAPISPLSNMMQAVFGAIAPGQILTNMVASGTTGTIATQSESLMQDYKSGYMIGSSPRNLTLMQLIATPIGAATVSWVYPLLRQTYGIVGDHAGLSSPISRKWAGFAEILSRGVSALPAGAMQALVIGAIIGVLLTVLESRKLRWLPSPTGIGIGMLVPAAVIIVMFLGSVVESIWSRVAPESHRDNMVPLASGLIAGEAIIAVIIPILVVLGVLH
jgi:uncharacterized oligopeptide transporter (OPT) family protein